ncbi:MAG: gliding motility-associated C-terminal domain-containing protein [Bacteroidetes bacterium]|nr:gliding motility-associated C-terminal domain-containing protein [Bacteroidota bacterium]
MKPQLTLVALFLFFGTLTAQVKFKVKLLPDNQTYQVLFRPDITWNAPFNAVPSAQVTLKVPTGGFAVGTVTNLKGTWSHTGTIVSPSEAPGYDYVNFGLQSVTSAITFQSGVEVAVFNFINTGSCTGPLDLMDNGTDPFMPPNSQNVNVGNAISVAGAGAGVNAYTGNYSAIPADCESASDCGIEVFDIILTPPSACGVADGSIEIVATTNIGLPLQYTINGGSVATVWQSSPIFPNLASGDLFDIRVRDIAAICEVLVGDFELDGPLAAIVQSIDIVQPDCGGSNGSITINAISANGGTLQYAMDQAGPWQVSPTFNGLAEGIYSFWVRDIINNCQNFVGSYVLDGCLPENCILTYDLQYLGNGRYEVLMITDTTWTFPNNITSSMQVTVKVPTGGFTVDNLTSQVTNVNFAVGSTYVSPSEDPAFDYISFMLASPGTQGIPYVTGNVVHLFTFENSGACTGDSVRLMKNDDLFFPPNSQNANVGQQITVSGYGGADAPICFGNSAVICDAVVPTCLITYEIEKLAGGLFQVSMISDTTWTLPNNITSSLQVTVKVPAGGFVASDLTTSVANVIWSIASTNVAPAEEPGYDYISFILASPGTSSIPFTAGVKTPLFTFKNSGTCQGGQVILMDNNTDPFFPPNSQNSNVGQQISVAGYGGADAPVCISNLSAEDCTNDPCASLVAAFTAPDACQGVAISFNDTSTSSEAITSWNWDFGDNSAQATEETPSHIYSSSGNFEVSLTVTTQSGCTATFSDFVTVFSLPGNAPVSTYTICNGLGVTLQAPANIASAVWSPTTGLDDPNSQTPFAGPVSTTVYTVTATNGNGCVSTSQVTVQVLNKPLINNVTVTQQSDCGVQDASILVAAVGADAIEYTINSIDWQANPLFSNLAAGTYNVFVRNADDSCPVAYNGNPVVIDQLTGPTISSVTEVQPNGCNDDGSITITASGGNGALQYSITGGQPMQGSNVFSNLGAGTYQIVVMNNDGTCAAAASDVVFTEPAAPTVVTPVADFNLCEGASANISIEISSPISSYTVSSTGPSSNADINGSTVTFTVTPNLGQQFYTVDFIDLNGCTVSESFTVTGVAVPTADFSVSPTLCANGQVTLNFEGTASPSAYLNWDLAGGVIGFASQQNATDQDSSTIIVTWATGGTKNILLSVDNGGCIVTQSTTIDISNFNPGATLVATNATCGQSNGAINLSLNSGGSFDFDWSNQATTQNLANLAGGTYQVTITETGSGCSATASATVGSTAALSISNLVGTPATDCTGSNGDGSLAISVSGGAAPFTYALTGAGADQFQGNLTSVTFNDLIAGAYQVVVTDVNGCSDIETVAITATSSQMSATVTVQDAGCAANDGSLSVNVTGGTAPYTYNCYQNNQPSGTGLPVSSQPLTISNLAPGAFVFVFFDANGCVTPVVANVERSQGAFTATAAATPAGCGANDGSILLTGVPAGATLAWEDANGNALGSANPLQNLAIGVYVATLTEVDGCVAESTFVVQNAAGPDVTVNSTTPGNCGAADGSVTFTVASGNSFSYTVLGVGTPGFGTPGNPVTASGLAEGYYVLEITDLILTGCKTYEPFAIDGGSAITTNSLVTQASGCGQEDGEICVEITGGSPPYAIISSQGFIQPGAVATDFCVTGLYEGEVEISITDFTGCVKTITVDLGEIIDPEITMDSIAITSVTCPGDFGSIVSVSTHQYQIFDANTTFVGMTPWTGAVPGTYTLMLTQGDCTVELDGVVVGGPAAWVIDTTVTPEHCEPDGSISLTISGGTAPYTVNWNNGATGLTIDSLSQGTYTPTITDDAGCTTTFPAISVGIDCNPQTPCGEAIFYIDTFNIQLLAALTEVCLPTDEPDITVFDLLMNGDTYDRTIGDCGSMTNFYGFGMLPTPPPYRLDEWTYGSNQAPTFDFNGMEDLVYKMNLLDPAGNWVLDANQSSIYGGAPGSTYGSMNITHIASITTLSLQVNTLTVPHPSIFVDNDRQVHVFIATNPATGCADTLYINMLEPVQNIDTMHVEVPVDSTGTVCIPFDELPGNIATVLSDCISFTGNALVTTSGDECVEVSGLDVGTDEACIIICDDLGYCDTTILLINVIDNSTDIEIFNGFSPNADGVNDFFTIRNIEHHPKNTLRVYNRWGKQVFGGKAYQNTWNAVYRNAPLPDGSYFYFLDIEIKGEKKEFTGFVEVRR